MAHLTSTPNATVTIQNLVDKKEWGLLKDVSYEYNLYENGYPFIFSVLLMEEGATPNDLAKEVPILMDGYTKHIESKLSKKADKKEIKNIIQQENLIKFAASMLGRTKSTPKSVSVSRPSKVTTTTTEDLFGEDSDEDKDDSDKKNIRTATYLSSVDELNSFYKEFGRGNDNFGKKVLRDNMIDIYNKSIKERLKKKQKEREKLESKKSIGKAGKTKNKHDKTKLTKEIKSIKNELLKQENKSQSIKLGKTFITLNKAQQNIESGNYELNIKNATMRRTIMAE